MAKEETPDDVELAAYKALKRIAAAAERIAKVLEQLAEDGKAQS